MEPRLRLRIPATLTVAVIAGCMDSAAGSNPHLDAALVEDRTASFDTAVVPDVLDDVRQADLRTEVGSTDVLTAAESGAPDDAGRCQNVSFFLHGCVRAVDYPDGAELVDAYDETCAPDPEPNCA